MAPLTLTLMIKLFDTEQLNNHIFLQAESWIEDKLKIAKEESFKNVRDIQDKMNSLKKHQAFEAEIMANAPRIRTIKEVSNLHKLFKLLYSYSVNVARICATNSTGKSCYQQFLRNNIQFL